MIRAEEFFTNFALHGVISTYVHDVDLMDPAQVERTDYIDAKILKFVPCDKARWVIDLQKSVENGPGVLHSDRFMTDLDSLVSQGICMDENSLLLFNNKGASRGMKIELRRCGETNTTQPKWAPH